MGHMLRVESRGNLGTPLPGRRPWWNSMAWRQLGVKLSMLLSIMIESQALAFAEEFADCAGTLVTEFLSDNAVN